jgi:CheY-like chemotaxis protein
MAITVVLGVGLDSWQLATQSAVWRSAGYIVVPTHSIREAIEHFRAGDFDLVLLGKSMSVSDKERLTLLIRASGSRTPVVCVSDTHGEGGSFAEPMRRGDPGELLANMQEVMAGKSESFSPATGL